MEDPTALCSGDPVHLESLEINEDGEVGFLFCGHNTLRG